MTKYVIMRHEKLKTIQDICGSLSHNFRERETPNADPDRAKLNSFLGGRSTAETIAKYKKLLPEKVRKDAVLAIEYLITASPEFFKTADTETQNSFFKESLEWLREKFGSENIFQCTVHRDETTPHLVAYIIPLKDGKLNAKHYIGGTRDALRQEQTSIANKLAHFGLTRGKEGSKATHRAVNSFYKLLEEQDAGFNVFALQKKAKIGEIQSKLYLDTKNESERLKREFDALTSVVKNLKNENSELSSQVSSLTEKVSDLSQQLRNDRDSYESKLRAKDTAFANAAKNNEKIMEYRNELMTENKQLKRALGIDEDYSFDFDR